MVSAERFIIQSATPQYINRTFNTLVNFTLNNTGNFNITHIEITLPFGFTFLAGSNGTTTPRFTEAVNFTNSSTFGSTKLIWTNLTKHALVKNFTDGITRSEGFWFNITAQGVGDTIFTVLTNDTGGFGNVSQQTLTLNFAFTGFVKNDTGNAGNVNVTIYQFIQSAGIPGPPQERIAASTLSAADGSFNLPTINGSAQLYTLKLISYVNNIAQKVGSNLPPFPAIMYFPAPSFGPDPAFEFMRPPTINGTTFYLQPAATLRLAANNASHVQKFGYIVMDQKLGFPVASNIQESVTSADIVVPIGRSYTALFTRMPNFFPGGSGFQFNDGLCDGSFMNDTVCPTPPLSNSSFGTLTEGQVLLFNQSLIVNKYRLTGCIGITQGHNNTGLNITNLVPKMVPWPGFVPPMRADRGDINLTTDINYTRGSGGCSSTSLASYNISVMGSASGINYLIEFYAKNATTEDQTPGVSAWQLASFKNTTVTTHTNMNITLARLTGSYWGGGLGAVNTSTIKVNVQNSTGGAITTNMHLAVSIKHPVFGTMTYIIEGLTNGTFYIPILNNSNWAKVKVFANDAPPKELTINLTTNETSIRLVTMTDGKGAGFKKINSTGQVDFINSTFLTSTTPITMRFLRNSNACNILNPPDSCLITSMSAQNFNPFKALVAGKINMEVKITSTNVTMTFMNFDMFAAKQPPMDSVINDQAETATTSSQLWKFGSFAPADTYDYVVIGMPYSDTASASNFLNDSFSYTLSLPLLYDENWNTAWNRTRGDSTTNIPDDFIAYNTSLYSDYLTAGGASCTKENNTLASIPCYLNTTENTLWMRIPHFSGIAPSSSGTAPVTVATTSSTTSSSGTGSGGGSVQLSYTLSELKAGIEQTLTFSNTQLGVESILLTTTRALSDVKITLLEHKEQPNGTNPPPFSAYKYFEVNPANLVASDIAASHIIFTVTKEWLTSKQGLPEYIALYKNTDGWVKLPVQYLGETETLYRFQADTHGFSYFAIGLESATQQAPPTETAQTPSTTPASAISLGRKIFSGKLAWFTILVIVLILFFFIKGHRGKK